MGRMNRRPRDRTRGKLRLEREAVKKYLRRRFLAPGVTHNVRAIIYRRVPRDKYNCQVWF